MNTLAFHSTSLTLGLNWRARSDLVFDLRANASDTVADSRWSPVESPAPQTCYQLPGLSGACDYLLRLSITGVGQVVTGSEGRRSQSQYQLRQSAAWNHGAHSVRFGADYVRLAPARRDASKAVSVISDSLDGLADNNFWTANSPRQDTSTVVREISGFAEDTWRLAPRLTATYGLRWEISPAPLPGDTAYFLDSAKGQEEALQQPIWRSTYGNFAPRLGLAFRPTASTRTVIRAGGGIYFDSSLSLATDLINDGPLNFSQFRAGGMGSFQPCCATAFCRIFDCRW